MNRSITAVLDQLSIDCLTANEEDRNTYLFKARQLTAQVLHLNECLTLDNVDESI